jgi:PKD repeat protein
MRFPRALISAGTAVCVVAGISLTPMTPAEAVAGATADYEMNEPAGSSVMTDSSGNGLNGVIDPTGVQTGAEFDGATAYNWVRRSPEQAPPSPERVIQVPDNINLEPGNQPFTIELRYRTQENFGNIIQKGQAQTPGGQWKIQNPGGIPSCLFKGSLGQVATAAKTPLNDDQWHNLTCVYNSSGVTMYVDGVFRNRKNGSAGTVDNNFALTVGGKMDCDQIDITCDYFSGQIDYVRFTKAANQIPTADFASSCAALLCSFDSSAAADPDGSIASYAWTFGDGATSTTANPTHTYAAAGTYNARLTVTDNQGATRNVTKSVTVTGVPVESTVAFVGSAVSAASNNNPTVTVPAATIAGQRLVMALSLNDPTRTISDPTGVTGWTKLDTLAAGTMSTSVWTKVAQAGDPGAVVHIPMSGAAKYTLTVAAYSGVDSAPVLSFARSSDTTNHAARPTPDVTAPAGSWVVSYWADKSATTTAWTPDPSVTTRATGCTLDSGRICSAWADSGVPVPAGTYGHITATTNASSDKATMWSIVLPRSDQPPGNVTPTADFTPSCTFLDCGFDSSGSVDPDGSIASFAWTFGDGGTSTEADPSHSFATAGAYDVTLTVTDNQGATDSVTTALTVTAEPVDSPVGFVGSAVSAANSNNPTVTVPATAPGQQLVMLLSLNNTARTFSAPTGVTGWTQLDTVVAKTMSTTAWTKVAEAGDMGTAVHVPLSGVAKFTLTVGVYSGVDTTTTPIFARATDLTSNDTARATPDVTAPAGSWVLSYWADRSADTTAWTPAATVTARAALCGADAARICSLLADSAAPVPTGTYGHITASTSAPSDMATMWSIVLAPAP